MFSVELKVNGSLIAHIYGRNVTNIATMFRMYKGELKRCKDNDTYEYEYYELEKGIREGVIEHMRDEGLAKLVSLILLDILEEKG